jgi:hypothetical protein
MRAGFRLAQTPVNDVALTVSGIAACSVASIVTLAAERDVDSGVAKLVDSEFPEQVSGVVEFGFAVGPAKEFGCEMAAEVPA